jgi:hypothetical protein
MKQERNVLEYTVGLYDIYKRKEVGLCRFNPNV